MIWEQYKKHPLGLIALFVLALFCFAGIYAPFLASSQPIFVIYDGKWYFPLFRYLFYSGFYTKKIDLFFNLLIFTSPLICASFLFRKWICLTAASILQCALFAYLILYPIKDPTLDETLAKERAASPIPISWDFELKYMNSYKKLELILREVLSKKFHHSLKKEFPTFEQLPTIWQMEKDREEQLIAGLNQDGDENSQLKINYFKDRRAWLEEQGQKITWMILPLIRPFHWEEDAGGSVHLNQKLPWWQLSRILQKDLMAALIFGIRISMVVGIVSIAIALAIGIPIGAFAGYYGGTFDIFTCRLLEIWESMPVLFMLLLTVATLQTKSIFLVIAVIGLFGWTGFCRFIRGEYFKQRNLPYVEACHSFGFSQKRIIFLHILPNAIAPVLTLMPFAIMGAITSESGLSFLGLGEEGSCSWGVLMDEGRRVFPGQSYLLWPPAIILTILLIAIALVGDTLRDALDPKLRT